MFCTHRSVYTLCSHIVSSPVHCPRMETGSPGLGPFQFHNHSVFVMLSCIWFFTSCDKLPTAIFSSLMLIYPIVADALKTLCGTWSLWCSNITVSFSLVELAGWCWWCWPAECSLACRGVCRWNLASKWWYLQLPVRAGRWTGVGLRVAWSWARAVQGQVSPRPGMWEVSDTGMYPSSPCDTYL